MNLELEVAGLRLRDPFMVASSHWTDKDNAFRKLQPLRPSAVTLKTTSLNHGGNGALAIGSRKKHLIEDSFGEHFAVFTDGPKTIELLDLSTTRVISQSATEILPESKIGLSVLAGEPFLAIFRGLAMEHYGYVELNLKYTFRELHYRELDQSITKILEEVRDFLDVFKSLPRFVKLSREATRLLRLGVLDEILNEIRESDAAIIVANSLRTRVPPSYTSQNKLHELSGGVVVGEHLFLDTFDTIRCLVEERSHPHPPPPIVGAGGVTGIGSVIDLFAAGARAVQLCTALDRGVHLISLLRTQLSQIVDSEQTLLQFEESLCDPQHWNDAAAQARHHRVIPRRIARAVFSDKTTIESAFAATLKAELPNSVEINFAKSLPADAEVPIPELVVSLGNIGSFALACLGESDGLLNVHACTSAMDFCREITKHNRGWDIAVIPQSALRYLNRNQADSLQTRAPRPIANIGYSVYELAGLNGLRIKSLKRVYYFGGNSSRAALDQLLQSETVTAKIQEVSPADVFALLSAWEEDWGILAKPPLSRLYGRVVESQRTSEVVWDDAWACEEPLVLCASAQFLDSRPNARIEISHLMERLEACRGRLLDDVPLMMKIARAEGVLEHLQSLLVGEVR